MKVLFQGDSITDAGRDRSDYHNLGNGYPKYAAEYISVKYKDIEFINLGISGDQAKDLVDRINSDFIDINPDVISIMIGVNDTWHYASDRNWLDNETFEKQYRFVLEKIKSETNAKIIIIEQFLLPTDDKDYFREDLNPKIDITRKLAREFADVYIPLDGLSAKALLEYPSKHWSDDGVHPNANGSDFIGKVYAEAFDE
ncbi:MAG: SGNH/GDSL hydrolase family protein, partial [Clostridia bacterium]|nr:SGNH/GDSL hydrolase family protein [Clostridia bacterium]